MLLAPAAFAGAELAAAILFGRFFDWGRAEGLLFLAVRPWPLLFLVLACSRYALRTRALAYAAGLLLAASAESLMLMVMGGRPWAEQALGLAAAAGLAVLFDVAVQAGRRLGGRFGGWGAAALLGALLAVPQARAPYDAVIRPGAPMVSPGERPKVMLMSGLPLVWGEGGPFDSASRPAAAYIALQREFEFLPVDTLDPRSLSRSNILLLAQPQRLAPGELAALDAWVGNGGRALVFADPFLVWPSDLPLGDIRRPPPIHLLAPILDHWGVRIEEASPRRRQAIALGRRRLVVEAEGRVLGAAQREGGLVARFGIGRGRVILVADADLFRDDLWAPLGSGRAERLADNPLVVADWLDELAAIGRPRQAGDVTWRNGLSDAETAAAGVGPILLAGLAGTGMLRRRAKGVSHKLIHKCRT